MSNAKILRAVKMLREHAIGLDMEIEQMKRQLREMQESSVDAETPKRTTQEQKSAAASTAASYLPKEDYPTRDVLDAVPDLVPASLATSS